MTTVWIVQNDDYPMDRLTYGVAASVQAAARLVRESHPSEYKITWDEPVERGGQWRMTGHFISQPGLCVAGPQDYIFTPYELSE